MANRSQSNDRSGGWKLPRRRERGMRQDTHDRALGVRDANGIATIPSRAEQRQRADRQRPSGERQDQ